MKRSIILFSSLFIVICLLSHHLIAQNKKENLMLLSNKEQAIVSISAFTALGNMPELKGALNKGLDAGLTISEVKEVLVHLYAYTGFPRSLNALNNLMNVVNERKKIGINDLQGKEPTALKIKNMSVIGEANRNKLTGRKIAGGVYDFAPAIDKFLKEHLFGAIFSRDNLDWKTRELVTVAALAVMPGAESQLQSHFGLGIYNGLTVDQLSELVTMIETKAGKQRGDIARQVLQAVKDKKPYTASAKPKGDTFATGEKITNNNFTGNVWLQPLITTDSANLISVGNVTFEPGARSKWHLHPAGQILLAIDGVGYYQEKGAPKKILRKGDVVNCPPNVPHWHGASPDDTFVQVAITNNQNGTVQWLKEVTEEEYKN